MKTLESLAELWQIFFLDTPKVGDSDAWSIVFMARDTEQLLVSLANPFTDEHDEVFVKHVSSHDLALFIDHYKKRTVEQLPTRFGFFRPEVDSVLTEYPDWDTFYKAWLRSDPNLMQRNLPLLFDFPSRQEYRAMQLKDADHAKYRRLLVVVYQYRSQQFQKIFIQNIDDAGFERIQQDMTALYRVAMPTLIIPKT